VSGAVRRRPGGCALRLPAPVNHLGGGTRGQRCRLGGHLPEEAETVELASISALRFENWRHNPAGTPAISATSLSLGSHSTPSALVTSRRRLAWNPAPARFVRYTRCRPEERGESRPAAARTRTLGARGYDDRTFERVGISTAAEVIVPVVTGGVG